ncbi:beta-2-glycoprotein 1-like [Sycon ciliatum]|uniref:beta-2-glycoprotein 1-like n=1 Tax=Sycon ciliatum TaxID=27933 RepID=UPI0031F6F516
MVEDFALRLACRVQNETVNCAVPSVGNGTADDTMIRWGSNVSFSCNEGFLLKGDATSTCTVHGNLTSLPHCEAVNCAVPSVGNGTADNTMIRWGSNVSFSCNEGFLLKGDATSTCTVHGNLTSLPHCEAVNCAVPSVGNGTADNTMIRWGSNVSFSCNEGFLLKGDATSTCTVHGNLTSLPHCEDTDCYMKYPCPTNTEVVRN